MFLTIGLRVFTPVQTARINVRVYPALNMDIFAFLKWASAAELSSLPRKASHPTLPKPSACHCSAMSGLTLMRTSRE